MLAILGAIAVAGAGVAIGITLHGGATPAAAGGKSSPTAAAPSSAAPSPTAAPLPPAPTANLIQAVTWIGQQVGTSTVVACDPQTCAALTASGFPATEEAQLGPNPQSLAGASIVVVTPALRTVMETSPILGTYVAPTVLASFGQVSIQPTDSAGAAAYQTALAADMQARIQAGQQLVNSENERASTTAQSELAAGDVDPRLLLVLQALSSQVPIDILGFTDAGPGAGPGVPFREVALAATDPASGLSSSGYLQVLARVVTTHATFPAPHHAGPVTLPSGQSVVEIVYTAPSPLGLLGP